MLSVDTWCIFPTSTLQFENCLIRKDYVIDTTITIVSSADSGPPSKITKKKEKKNTTSERSKIIQWEKTRVQLTRKI